MDKSVFSDLGFTDQHQKAIRERVNKEIKDEDILLAVMQLLVKEKTGFELVNFLRGRGIRKFEENEGILYTLLHQLEQDSCLKSSWNEWNIKYYRLNNKGRKKLVKLEKQHIDKKFALKELFEG